MVDLPVLHTARLTLRRVRIEDAGPLNAMCNDWEVVKWLTRAPWPYPLVETQTWIATDPAAYVLIAADGPVGVIGLDEELGYWIGRSHWGRGYISEALPPVIACAFDRLGWSAIPSGYLEGNEKSARVLIRNGFRADGDERIFSRARNEPVLHHKMRLTRADWRALRLTPDGADAMRRP